jgi:hypothetical protein
LHRLSKQNANAEAIQTSGDSRSPPPATTAFEGQQFSRKTNSVLSAVLPVGAEFSFNAARRTLRGVCKNCEYQT